MKLLLIEDDPAMQTTLQRSFQRRGLQVVACDDGARALDRWRASVPDVVLLDLSLPHVDGLQVLSQARAEGLTTPVLILTARSRVEDRVDALDIGADDYLVKPFDFRELEARVRVLIRRNGGEATNLLRCGDISIDRLTRMVRVGDCEVHLKRRELTLLEILSSRPGRIFGKDELLDRMFGHDEAPGPNAVELYIGRLRRKIEGARAQIVTVRGFGYQMVIDGPA